jgi:hypothetical protein
MWEQSFPSATDLISVENVITVCAELKSDPHLSIYVAKCKCRFHIGEVKFILSGFFNNTYMYICAHGNQNYNFVTAYLSLIMSISKKINKNKNNLKF